MFGITPFPAVRERVASSGPLLQVEGLTVEFPTKRGTIRALTDVSFEVEAGERVAIVGESGSGKSVTAMSLLNLLPHPGRIVAGRAALDGRDVLGLEGRALRTLRGGSVTMVFQDPMTALNPVLRVSEQILPPLRRHLRLGASEARARALEVLLRTGIPDPLRVLHAYPHELSGGMRQRVLLAMALACSPRLLIADEPTTALDVTIQAQIVSLLKEISEQQQMAVLFITHDLGLVARFADRVAVMYAGRIVETAPVRQIFAAPRHPYTRALLAAIPPMSGPRRRRLFQIEGAPPDLAQRHAGCAFAPRCEQRAPACSLELPLLDRCGPAHAVACLEAEATTTPLREVARAV